jgi:hypothetical protein
MYKLMQPMNIPELKNVVNLPLKLPPGPYKRTAERPPETKLTGKLTLPVTISRGTSMREI